MVIKSFGKITDIIPSEIIITNDFQSWNILKKHLYSQYPALAEEFVLIAVNNKIISTATDFPLRQDDEIALMPPFSGG